MAFAILSYFVIVMQMKLVVVVGTVFPSFRKEIGVFQPFVGLRGSRVFVRVIGRFPFVAWYFARSLSGLFVHTRAGPGSYVYLVRSFIRCVRLFAL